MCGPGSPMQKNDIPNTTHLDKISVSIARLCAAEGKVPDYWSIQFQQVTLELASGLTGPQSLPKP